MGEKFTRGDIQKIEEEIEYRRLVVRKEALEAVKEARAQGDLSENFEYYAAKKEKNRNESRIRYLEKLLRNASVIEDHTGMDQVGVNSAVEVYIPDMETTAEYKIVTSIRGDSLKNYISTESPLGKALLGHCVGDVVTVHVSPEVSYQAEIRGITRDLGEDGDTIRSF